MSSSHALCCLPSVKKQKRDFHFFLGKGYQPKPKAKAEADNPYLDLIILDITKPHPNNTVIVYYNIYRKARNNRHVKLRAVFQYRNTVGSLGDANRFQLSLLIMTSPFTKLSNCIIQ